MTVQEAPDLTSGSRPASAASAIARARRAVLADRYAANSFVLEWRPLDEMAAHQDEWRTLVSRALEPNVFYEPAFALAAAPLFGRDAGALLVWSGNEPRRLLGLFPARIEKRRYGIKHPVLVGWTHPYAPLGTPLVERNAAEPVIAAWLGHLGRDRAMPPTLLMPLLKEDGPFAATLGAILQRAGLPVAAFGRHQRPQLAPGSDRLHYVENVLDPRRHRELRRTGRRLADLGALLINAATEPSAVAEAAQDFFALEASGWKGRAGTAVALHDDTRRFMIAVLSAFAAERRVTITRIMIDGRSIAAAITLRSGDQAWYWKTAYDDKFAHYAPGIFLTAALTERLADDVTLTATDSCAASDNPILDRVWGERQTMTDLLIGVKGGSRFRERCRSESVRRNIINILRRYRRKIHIKRG